MANFKVINESIYCVTYSRASLTKNKSEAYYDSLLGVFIRRYIFLQQHLNLSDFKQLDKLNMLAAMKLMQVISKGLGFHKLLEVSKLYRTYDICLFNRSWLNPIYLLSLAVMALRVKVLKR